MRKTKAQSVIEYFVILTLILAAILSTGFMGRIRDSFDIYFTTAVGEIVPTNAVGEIVPPS